MAQSLHDIICYMFNWSNVLQNFFQQFHNETLQNCQCDNRFQDINSHDHRQQIYMYVLTSSLNFNHFQAKSATLPCNSSLPRK